MSDDTPNGAGELEQLDAEAEGVQRDNQSQGGQENPEPLKEEEGAAEEATLTEVELLNELEAGKPNQEAPEATIVKEPKQPDSAANKAHESRLTIAVSEVENLIKNEGLTRAEAIEKIPEADIRGWLTKQLLGERTVETPKVQGEQPDVQALVTQGIKTANDESDFKRLYPQLISEAGLNKSTSAAIQKRVELMDEINRLNEMGMPKTEAAEYAASRLGLLTAKQVADARLEGARLGARALPKNGLPSSPPITKATVADNSNLKGMSLEEMERLDDIAEQKARAAGIL